MDPIKVRRSADNTYRCLDGRHQLIAMLQIFGRVQVMDINTKEILTVHEIGNSLVLVHEAEQRRLEALTKMLIEKIK